MKNKYLLILIALICAAFFVAFGLTNKNTGNAWLVFANAPTASTPGENGDFYLDTETYDIYQKTNDGWVHIGNIAGKDGVTPEIDINEEGYWVINGKVTSVKAEAKDGQDGTHGKDGIDGTDGKDGKDGLTPTITIDSSGYWVINGKKTEVLAIGTPGKDGQTPVIRIDENGYWIVNGEKTDVRAVGLDGAPGKDGQDGAPGKDGQDGKDGLTPTITISDDGYWIINDEKTDVKATGTPGNSGVDGRNVEFMVDNYILHWRYVGDSKWIVLYELPKPFVQLNISQFANGNVVPDKMIYRVGDTITLTVLPDSSNYSQKIYINNKPLKLKWLQKRYSFVATEEIYNITGSFEPSLNIVALDENRFDFSNQAHGVLNTYYPVNQDSWWADINGDYKSLEVGVKNLLPVDESYEGVPNGGFRIALRMTLDNGENYAFSIWLDTNKRYVYNHFGAGGSVTGWSGAWKSLNDSDMKVVNAINGDGVSFKLERISDEQIVISVDELILETYQIPDDSVSSKVVSVGVAHYGAKGLLVEIPFTVVKN